MATIKGMQNAETTVPVYRYLRRRYINKNDFVHPALLTFESTPSKQRIRVFSDIQGETFTTLFSIAVNCGFSSWTVKDFTETIRDVAFNVYRKVPSGDFMVRTGDVASIVEKTITAPFTTGNTQIDDFIINTPSKFLEWWKNTALNEIEKHACKNQSLFDNNAKATSNRNEVIDQKQDTPIFGKLCLSDKSMGILMELDLLILQVNRLIAADLPHVLAVKTAINIRRQSAQIDDYAPIIELIKRINPSINI